jgi:hypothetical protein
VPSHGRTFESFLFSPVLALAAITTAELWSEGTALADTRAEASAPEAERLYGNGPLAWIYAEPRRSAQPIGSLRAGERLSLAKREPLRGPGCAGLGFVQVKPRGYVCLDQNVALGSSGRYVRAMQAARASAAGILPFQYALSDGAPMYRRLPTAAESESAERNLGPRGQFQPLSRWQRGHEALAVSRPVTSKEKPPWFLRQAGSVVREREKSALRRYIPRGSMLAYTRAFSAQGRTWLLSSDGTIVPADRVRPYRLSTFSGVAPRGTRALPLAWTRGTPAPKFWQTADGAFSELPRTWGPRTPIALSMQRKEVWARGRLYLETRETSQGHALWVERSKVSVMEAQKRLPAGLGKAEKWIRFSITEGTLIAFRGLEPLYATLASPGAGGVPRPGVDLIKASTTPLGRFRVMFKHRARDMSPEQGDQRSFWIAEVPDTQYFQHPFALHTAYWHENFGEPMSAGCINLSPKDGRWLFDFTDPALPPGFSGVGAGGPHGLGTVVIVVR